MKRRFHLATTIGLTAVVALGLSACAPGGISNNPAVSASGAVSKNVAKGDITLTVWDQNVDSGINQAQDELNAEFEKVHPNITIKRVSRSFTDLKTTLKLALSGDDAPDVVQANQGYPDMGAFVKAGFLRPMNDYSTLYGWDGYFPSGLLKLNSFSANGKIWQGNNLYGVSQTGELIGLYYNKEILNKAGIPAAPKTLDGLTADMAKVKAIGALPLAYGDVDKYPGIHLYGFALASLAGRERVNGLIMGSKGSWSGSLEAAAAQTIMDWQTAGYITPGASGVSIDTAVGGFGDGNAAFAISGSWYGSTLATAKAASNIGFTALTPPGVGAPNTMGGEGLAWAMTSKAKNPDTAAAYINFITSKSAEQTLVKHGVLPIVVPTSDTADSGSVSDDITAAYRRVSKANGISPYLDYTTPTFYDTLTAGMQNMMGAQQTPRQFSASLQADYSLFLKTR